ncbi:MAG TPA: glycosyltransferase [Flavobacteriaceae bacterium]|nr:glycosyltransferase [Flavobacteriaceae bacterium]
MLSAFLIAFVAVIVVNIAFYVLLGNYSFAKIATVQKAAMPVSVIICAKNEADKLRVILPKMFSQNYPNFEVIVVNDASSDNTSELLKEFSKAHPQLQIVEVQNNEAFWANKKYALTLGIKKAKNNILLFTDPNTLPISNEWIATLAGQFNAQKQLLLGHICIPKNFGFWNVLMRFDNCNRSLFNFSLAKAGLPFSSNGKNLGYTAELFYAHRGFMSHMNIRAGEDELFINEAATGKNTAVCDHPNAFIRLQQLPLNKKDWIAHKKRRLLIFGHLKSGYQFLAGLHFFAKLAFWVLAMLSFIFVEWRLAILLIVSNFVFQYLFVFKGYSKLKEKELLYYLIRLEIVHLWVQISIFISNNFSRPKLWK